MTQEEKQLLLQDLCARLPYGVMVNVEDYDTEKLIGIENETITTKASPTSYSDKGEYPINIVKPYLRPMSSITEEEKEELKTLFDAEEITSDSICYLEGGTLEEYLSHISYSFCSKIIDWLNRHHFDYRGLIEKGLAIAVTEENNPYKE